MSFIGLFKYLEQQLGYHQFPVNELADDLPKLFESSATHHDLVVKLSHKIFKANHCQKMSSAVDQAKVEKVLGEIRLEIINNKKTDIDLYHFIDDVCFAIAAYFDQQRLKEA